MDLQPSGTTALKAREESDLDLAAKRKIDNMVEIRPFTPEELDERKFIHPAMHNREILNAFRELRTKLVQRAEGENFVCMVSSVVRGGGASYIAINLASAFALDKRKTSLLVDCNLYESAAEKLLHIDVDYGLTDYLDDPALGVKDIIYASGIPRMRFIPIGGNRESGAEHFSSDQMRRFIDAVKGRYPDRYIVLDAPPMATSAEAQILAELCDQVILVVPYGMVTQPEIVSAVELVKQEKLAGVVFNN